MVLSASVLAANIVLPLNAKIPFYLFLFGYRNSTILKIELFSVGFNVLNSGKLLQTSNAGIF